MDELYFWACRNCGDYGQITFIMDRCRSCDRLVAIEDISKPKRKSDGIKKPPTKPKKNEADK
jgi:hypothetical protein